MIDIEESVNFVFEHYSLTEALLILLHIKRGIPIWVSASHVILPLLGNGLI
jgi:hypothetical protein